MLERHDLNQMADMQAPRGGIKTDIRRYGSFVEELPHCRFIGALLEKSALF